VYAANFVIVRNLLVFVKSVVVINDGQVMPGQKPGVIMARDNGIKWQLEVNKI